MKRYFVFFLSSLIAVSILISCSGKKNDNAFMNEKLPMDSTILYGKLDNGLTYYIKENKKPEKRAFLRLVVKTGSVTEDQDQRGLAHFTEHMLFNGTKNFPKNDLVSFLESTGMRFGADINAATSYDQTHYMLELPTDSAKIFKKGFQVLEDWAHLATFDSNEIDKERGVVVEEWRTRNSAFKRVFDQNAKYILKGSRYLERDVIGDTNILKHAKYDVIRRYYKDWYRPDLMAVIAVGDFDKYEIEKMIKEHFGGIKNPQNERERKEYTIPPHKGIMASIAKDKELPYVLLQILYKRGPLEEGTVEGYKTMLMNQLIDGMFGNRLDELKQKPNPPFIQTFAGNSRFLGNIWTFSITGILKPNEIDKGTDAIFTEAIRLKQNGFTKTELDRQKEELLKSMEKMYKEKDKTESARYANEYTGNFLYHDPIPGITEEYDLTKKLLPMITLEDINSVVKEYLNSDNSNIALSVPDKEGLNYPTTDELISMYDKIDKEKLAAYNDESSSKPLFDQKLKEGSITEEKEIPEVGVTELTLSNGARVILKQTDFKNDEVLLSAFSPGGTSLSSDQNFLSAESAVDIIRESGISDFTKTQLEKKLSGKMVTLRPYIGELSEGFSGSSTPGDLETMFQLLHLYFTNPRDDANAFKSYIDRSKSAIANRNLDPRSAFNDTVAVTLNSYNYRKLPLTEERLNKIDNKTAFDFYKDRFADASDFTFIIVGKFDMQKMKDLLKKYVATLPSQKRNETWKDVGIKLPEGKIDKKVVKGILDKSTVRLTFSGKLEWSPEKEYLIRSLTQVMNIILREQVREEKSGTYGVGVWPIVKRYPTGEYEINIQFDCKPKRVDELVSVIMKEIAKMKEKVVGESYIQKVKEMQKREYQTNLEENSFWINKLFDVYWNGLEPASIIKYPEKVDKLSADEILQAAKKYLNMENFVKIVLYPEKQKES